MLWQGATKLHTLGMWLSGRWIFVGLSLMLPNLVGHVLNMSFKEQETLPALQMCPALTFDQPNAAVPAANWSRTLAARDRPEASNHGART
jgi:hypothetical protein